LTLSRFRDAQDADDSFATALAELRAGQKRTHWVWWIFPNLRSLGTSQRAIYYGIDDEAEARAYLADPILRCRLLSALSAVCGHVRSGETVERVMGSEVDAVKLRSCLSLFAPLAASLAEDDAACIAECTRAILGSDPLASVHPAPHD
jgi:uncharacterized protein (DUF1810 family)